MTVSLWNIAAYALQLAALVTVAVAAAWALGIRMPRHSLRLWQTVMAMALLLPLAQPRHVEPSSVQVFTETISAAALPRGGEAIVPTGINAGNAVLLLAAAGIIVRLLWLGLGLIKVRSIVARATADESLADITRELTQSLGVTAAVRVSGDLEGPATVGVRHPVVLLPHSVTRMSDARPARDPLSRAPAREAPRLAAHHR